MLTQWNTKLITKVVGLKPIGLNQPKRTKKKHFFCFKWFFLDLSYFRLHKRGKKASTSRKCTFKWYKAQNIYFNPPSNTPPDTWKFCKIYLTLDLASAACRRDLLALILLPIYLVIVLCIIICISIFSEGKIS